MSGIWLALLAACLGFASPCVAKSRYHITRFDDLLGWQQDDQTRALAAFIKSCADISADEWKPLCAFARTEPNARTFFETMFLPVVVSPNSAALFTGYFEPVLTGARIKTGKYKFGIYRKPKNLSPRDANLTRAKIDDGALDGKGLAIAYVDDPVSAYYLHIQGSGRINLTDGKTIRVGYAGENGHVYRSAAQHLVSKGSLTLSQASIEGIQNWYRNNPSEGKKALEFNASYVFFRELAAGTLGGPLGALDRPLSAGRSIAIDPRYTQIGAPVWIEKGGFDPMRRLMVAQDVGSAIKGPQRADIFFGTGVDAGLAAGKTRDTGRMVVLLPIDIALRLGGGG